MKLEVHSRRSFALSSSQVAKSRSHLVDLDSVASALAFAYFSSVSNSGSRRYAAMIFTARGDMFLRPENLAALTESGIDPSDLLCVDDLFDESQPVSSIGVSWALVDHNRLSPRLGEGRVVAVIDHHADEGLYHDATPRLLQVPTGSCASLVTTYFQALLERAPPELANLLLSAILIDTSNLKNKTTETDTQAVELLISRSSLGSLMGSSVSLALSEKHQHLRAKKEDIGSLGLRDLLRRDYKEYETENGWRYGLSSTPNSLQDWSDRQGGWQAVWAALDDWAQERKLDLVGVLSSFKGLSKKGNPKHLRELLVAVKRDELRDVWTELETASDLKLGEWMGGDAQAKNADMERVWQQGNTRATRKQVAPLLKQLIEARPAKT
jgi:exopolyphosphatase